MEKTEKYALNLYEANDLPNLLDGYNGSMNIIDENMQRIDDAATAAMSEAAKAQTSADSAKEAVSELEHVVTDHETLINNNAADIATVNQRTKGDILFIGDSYADGYTPNGTITSWIELVIKALSNTHDINTYSYHEGGVGFSNGGYNELLVKAKNELTDIQKKNISTIYIGGGFNDWNQTFNSIKAGINTVVNTIKNAFGTQVVIYADWFGKGVTNKTTGVHSDFDFSTLAQVYGYTVNYLNSVGFSSDNDAIMTLTLDSMFSDDYVHPSEKGQTAISNYVVGRLLSGKGVFSLQGTNTTGGSVQLQVMPMTSNFCEIAPTKFQYFADITTASYTLNGNTHIDLGQTISFNATLQTDSDAYLPAYFSIHDATNSKYITCGGLIELHVSNKTLNVRAVPLAVQDDGKNYLTITTNQIQYIFGRNIVQLLYR